MVFVVFLQSFVEGFHIHWSCGCSSGAVHAWMDRKLCYSQKAGWGHWAQASEDSSTDDLLRHTHLIKHSFSLPLAKIWQQGQAPHTKVLFKSAIQKRKASIFKLNFTSCCKVGVGRVLILVPLLPTAFCSSHSLLLEVFSPLQLLTRKVQGKHLKLAVKQAHISFAFLQINFPLLQARLGSYPANKQAFLSLPTTYV